MAVVPQILVGGQWLGQGAGKGRGSKRFGGGHRGSSLVLVSGGEG